MKQIIELNGEKYTWTGNRWTGKDNLTPPTAIIIRLNQLLSKLLMEEDQNITDIYLLSKRARMARENKQYQRAAEIARRIINLQPDHHEGLAILCASLREIGFPDRALEETEEYAGTQNPALLTSRAAAYCDMGKWKMAKKTIGRSLAIQKSAQAFKVVSRIKKARPDLYG